MYLTSLYHGLREYSPQGGRKRRKLDVSVKRFTMFTLRYDSKLSLVFPASLSPLIDDELLLKGQVCHS